MTVDVTRAAAAPRILLVGAYERDNFGDLLFLLVTEQYLHGPNVVAAAPFSSDMTTLLGREVPAYGPLLQEQDFDVVWTVGGQVGGVGLASAYTMSCSREDLDTYRAASLEDRDAIIRRATGIDTPIVSPYMPSVADFPRNAGSFSTLNSVGLSGIRKASLRRREELIGLLRDQDRIVVRDAASRDYLDELGIRSHLTPDAVHAIGVLQPAAYDPTSDIAIVQANSAFLRKLGPESVAEHIAASQHLKGLRLRLLMAGTATGHDSAAAYSTVVERVRRIDPTRDIEIITDRKPFDLVNHLRTAKVVIGTSLHVRVVSSAYGVPRVTLKNPKASQYASYWDPDMPFDVEVRELDEAIERALASRMDPVVQARSAELCRLAHENLQQLRDEVNAVVHRAPEDVVQRANARIRHREGRATRLQELTERDADLVRTQRRLQQAERRLARTRSNLLATKRKLAQVTDSRSYHAATRVQALMTRVHGKLRKSRR